MIRAGLLMLCALMLPIHVQAQKPRKRAYPSKPPSESERFLQTQWWLGFKAGANTTAAIPEVTYNGFSPINYQASGKAYDDYSTINGQAGLEITFYHKGFSFSLQPNYRRQSFTYTNSFEWLDPENAENSLTLNYNQNHQLDYIEIPLFIKYDITRTALRPFIQIGAYYATLISAQKHVDISGTDYASGNVGPFETQTIILGVDNQFLKSSTGIAGGIGFSYDFWNVRMIFDVTYRYGLNNVTNVKNRYSENQLASIGDALDDIKFKNIAVSIGCVFPLRFINNSYNSTN